MSTAEDSTTEVTFSDTKLLDCMDTETDTKEETTIENPFAALTSEKLRELMESEAPTVDAVLLKANGDVESVRYNTTPKVNDANRILGSNPTIIGQWEDLQVIILCGIFDGAEDKPESVAVNTHNLRFPFNEHTIHGDILLFRSNDEAVAQNFSVDDYKTFAANASEDVGKVWKEPEAIVWEDDDVNNEDDNDVAEDGKDNDEDFAEEDLNNIDPQAFDEMLNQIIRKQFNDRFNREPSAEELETFKSTIAARFGQEFDPDFNPQMMEAIEEENSEDDSEYLPDAEEIASAEKQDAEDDANLEDAEEKLEEEDDDATVDKAADEIDEEDFGRQYAEAIAAVQAVGARDGGEMLGRILGDEDTDVSTIATALKAVRDTFFGEDNDEENDEEDVDADANEENGDVKEDDTDEIDADAFSKELNEALDVIRKVGKQDGIALAEKVAATFEEVNGRQPTVDELKDAFGRIQQDLAAEAQEEVLEEIVARIDALPNESANIDSLSEEQRSAVMATASIVVTKDMASQALDYFTQLTSRAPTASEFDDLLLSIATTKFVEDVIGDENSDDDSDYDPTAPEELEQLKRDEELDAAVSDEEEVDSEDEADKENLEEEMTKLMNESQEVNGPRPAMHLKPVAFYSPVITPDSKRRSRVAQMKATATKRELELDRLLFTRAVNNFTTTNGREPNDEEIATLRSFLGQTEKFVHTAPIDFGAESDSDNEDIVTSTTPTTDVSTAAADATTE